MFAELVFGDLAIDGLDAVCPDGSDSPAMEARICSSLLWPAIWTEACCTSIMRPDTVFCASSAEPSASAYRRSI